MIPPMEYNEQQTIAINCNHRDIITLAVPGAGKTRVLIARIERLVQEGQDPKRMVAISFTISAGQEIKQRLADKGISIGYCGTLHSWLFRQIVHHHRTLGFRTSPTVLSAERAREIIVEHAASLKYTGSIKELYEELSVPRPKPTLIKASVRSVALAVHRFLQDRSWLTFETLLSYGATMAKRLEPSHLFVDEVQDCNRHQFEIYAGCMAEHRFLVGDPAQSIFGFNGGSPEFIAAFIDMGFHVLTLERNYRCPPPICDLANALADKMESTRRTYSVSAKPHAPCEIKLMDPQGLSQERQVAQWIREAIATTKSIAVLCRLNEQVNQWKEFLTWNNIPLSSSAASIPPDWSIATQAVRVLCDPLNPYTVAEWFRMQNGQDQADTWLLASLVGNVTPPDWTRAGSTLQALSGAGVSVECMSKMVEVAGDTETPQELLLAMMQAKFTQQDSEGVVVTSMHGAKGREFDTVILPDFDSHIIPANRPVEEDRRLAFVAVTRSSRFLGISWTQEPSLFLYEMGLLEIAN